LHDQVEMRRRLARPDQHLARLEEGDVGCRRELALLWRGQVRKGWGGKIECDRHWGTIPLSLRDGSGRGNRWVSLCRLSTTTGRGACNRGRFAHGERHPLSGYSLPGR